MSTPPAPAEQDAGKRAVETPAGVERLETRARFIPAVDIYEAGEEIVLSADVPGVPESGVELTLEKNVLTIVGRVKDAPDAGTANKSVYREYEVGDYERSFTVPEGVDRDKISAAIKDGVLTVRLPKAAPTTRKIAVAGA